MAAFDAGFLLLMLDPSAKAPQDPATRVPVSSAKERIELLLKTLGENKRRIIVPTPALCELLGGAGNAMNDFLKILNNSARFRIADFDQRAAIDLAVLTQDAIRSGDKRGGSVNPWQKVKFDRQIVAIAKREGARTIYTTDTDLGRFGREVRLEVFGVHDLPLPPQGKFAF